VSIYELAGSGVLDPDGTLGNGHPIGYAAIRCGNLSRSWTNADDPNMYPPSDAAGTSPR
jgi:hypothetical protein